MTNSVCSPNANAHTVSSFFSGVGGIELGFEQTGEFRVVYANEFDKNAQITFSENHPHIHLDKRDIHTVKETEVPDSTVIAGGFPCQAFSIAGYRKGFEDERGDLFFELLRIIKFKQPRVIFIENVKNMVSHDHGNTFKVIREALTMNGYHIKWKVMNGKDYGNVPQNRERIYIVGFKNKDAYNQFSFPQPIELTTKLTDVIDYDFKFNEVFYYRENKQPFYNMLVEEIKDTNKVYQWRRKYVRENKSGPNSFKLPFNMSNGQLYKQAGNSVVVPVIKRIAQNISLALENTTDTIFTYESVAKYSIMYTKMNGKYDGESHIVQGFNTESELNNYKLDNNIEFITPENYLKIIKNNKHAEFYSCQI